MRRCRPDMEVSARTTVQKANHGSLCRTVAAARELGASSISFLAADLTSAARYEPFLLNGATIETENDIVIN
ncbi:MAG: hypothetical protein ACXWCW_30580, partial [Burkholderiales bacterium]